MKLRSLALSIFAFALAFASQAAAERIISLAGEVTEIVYALDAQDQLVAVDATSVYPAAANDLPNVGYYGRLSAEALMAFEPTLVIANNQAGPPEVLAQLEAAGVRVVHVGDEPSLETPAANVRLVAELVGAQAKGEEVAEAMSAKLAAAAARGAELDPKPRVLFLYLGARSMQFAGGTNTASNVLIEVAGAIDVGAELGFSGYAPFTPEAIAAAAPDALIVTDRGIAALGSEDAVFEIPGISDTPAAAGKHLKVFEDLYFLGLGLRTGDALTELVDYLYSLQ
ncbi:MAG: ABC transporter substrate-binding protein [Trueperaceae bacterium]|nr:ABC transporter substrate-binding protein [Trueperaceae bacterium]MCO5174625.1 ABC transporter substrate-binding protein [Trueperaceae bacterium]MCW5819358.1 ABC transporter substrate-binding protein [Trueperaceae bacterium]